MKLIINENARCHQWCLAVEFQWQSVCGASKNLIITYTIPSDLLHTHWRYTYEKCLYSIVKYIHYSKLRVSTPYTLIVCGSHFWLSTNTLEIVFLVLYSAAGINTSKQEDHQRRIFWVHAKDRLKEWARTIFLSLKRVSQI